MCIRDRQTEIADRQAKLRQQYRALHCMQSHGKNGVVNSGLARAYVNRLLRRMHGCEYCEGSEKNTISVQLSGQRVEVNEMFSSTPCHFAGH